MALLLRCGNQHEWSMPEPTSATATLPTCPVCGQTSIHEIVVDDHVGGATIDLSTGAPHLSTSSETTLASSVEQSSPPPESTIGLEQDSTPAPEGTIGLDQPVEASPDSTAMFSMSEGGDSDQTTD